MKTKDIARLIECICISELAGGIGSLFTAPSIPTWYEGLVKPSFNPPNWLFGPVWTLLFALMGIGLFLVWRRRPGLVELAWTIERKKRQAIWMFGVQLSFNVLWSIIFFGFNHIGLALLEIIALWVSIVATIYAFYKVSRLAALLLVPYIAWVTFASILNYALWTLN